jgi:hypothetical protein
MSDWQTWALLERLAKIDERLDRIEQALALMLGDDDEPGDMSAGNIERAPTPL